MSHAFIRESDGQSLDEIGPSMNALILYLSRDNNGIRVYEKKKYFHEKEGRVVYQMSNGMTYGINNESKWYRIVSEL
jgi:hypothetical protein